MRFPFTASNPVVRSLLHNCSCAALQHRSSCGGDGLGQHIQSSLLETQVFALANVASNWLTAGQEAQRLGNAHPSIVPYQTFKAADCELAVGAGNNKQVQAALESVP